MLFCGREIADTPNPHTSQSHHSTPTHHPDLQQTDQYIHTCMQVSVQIVLIDVIFPPPSLHDVCVQRGVRMCVCLFDMSVLAEAVCLQGHIKHTSHSLANNLHSFSALFSLDSVSVSVFSVAYSLHLHPSMFLSLHHFSFSHQEKYPNFSTF